MAATDPPPSRSGSRSLDAVNLFLAGALSGFGPYVAVFLAEQKWTQQNIGFALTAGGFAGLLSQLPSGELLDAIRSKRVVVASGAIMVATSALQQRAAQQLASDRQLAQELLACSKRSCSNNSHE